MRYTGSKEWIGLNLNNVICFKPTEKALEIIHKYSPKPVTDDDGYYFFTIYHLIQVFGEHMWQLPLGRIAENDEIFVDQQMDYGTGKLIRDKYGFEKVEGEE